MPDQVIILDPRTKKPITKTGLLSGLTDEQKAIWTKIVDKIPELLPYLAAFAYGYIVGYQNEKTVEGAIRVGMEAIIFYSLAATLPANSSLSPTQIFGVAGLTSIGLSLPTVSIIEDIKGLFGIK